MKKFFKMVGFSVTTGILINIGVSYLKPVTDKLVQKAYFRWKKFKHRKEDIRNVVKIK